MTTDFHLHHHEEHFQSSATVRDIVIGMADGLTVPFALAAGLAGAVASTQLVITAGIAEIAAGSIAMGLGGYLAAKSEAEHYASELKREYWEIEHKADFERQEVEDVFKEYNLPQPLLGQVVDAICADKDHWVDFMMRFELGLEKPAIHRAIISALTIGGAYIVGGLIPLLPYILLDTIGQALPYSVFGTLMALLVFGFIKGHFTGMNKIKSALQTLLIGGLAAAAAYFIAQWIGS